MENGNSSFLLWISTGICFMLLLSITNAENQTEPRTNANLSPFESWRSAYFCLKNYSDQCSGDNTLTFNGTLVVNQAQIISYCTGGCYQHTKDILSCISDVKRKGFKFETGASLSFVQDAIDAGCSMLQEINTTYSKPNSATNLYGRLNMPIVSTLTTLAIIATFNV